MIEPLNVKSEMLRNAKMVVPPVIGMSIVLGAFNAPHWTIETLYPKIALSLSIAIVGCILGLLALFAGLLIAKQMRSVIGGWLAGLGVGIAGIAFMLWFYANPVN